MEPDAVHVRAALNGLKRSIPGSGLTEHVEALEAVGSALFWACALDEQLGRLTEYKSRRNQHASGKLLPALRLGRNAIAHGAAVIVMPVSGRTWPAVWPLVWEGAVWSGYEAVRSGLDGDPKPSIRMIWEQNVAGASVPATLSNVYDWLDDAVRKFMVLGEETTS